MVALRRTGKYVPRGSSAPHKEMSILSISSFWGRRAMVRLRLKIRRARPGLNGSGLGRPIARSRRSALRTRQGRVSRWRCLATRRCQAKDDRTAAPQRLHVLAPFSIFLNTSAILPFENARSRCAHRRSAKIGLRQPINDPTIPRKDVSVMGRLPAPFGTFPILLYEHHICATSQRCRGSDCVSRSMITKLSLKDLSALASCRYPAPFAFLSFRRTPRVRAASRQLPGSDCARRCLIPELSR